MTPTYTAPVADHAAYMAEQDALDVSATAYRAYTDAQAAHEVSRAVLIAAKTVYEDAWAKARVAYARDAR